jgi:hypothetical protein
MRNEDEDEADEGENQNNGGLLYESQKAVRRSDEHPRTWMGFLDETSNSRV